MDERSKKELDNIRTLTPAELTKHQIAFLKARRTYLTLDDKERFSSILIEKKK